MTWKWLAMKAAAISLARMCLAALIGITVTAPLVVAAEKPNVLFIVVDDLRPELGCYGVRTIKSPHTESYRDRTVRPRGRSIRKHERRRRNSSCVCTATTPKSIASPNSLSATAPKSSCTICATIPINSEMWRTIQLTPKSSGDSASNSNQN